MSLARRQYGGDDYRSCMNRTALERVVEVLAVGGGTVHERRALDSKTVCVADDGARSVLVDRLQRRPHIGLPTSSDTQAGDVEHQLRAVSRVPAVLSGCALTMTRASRSETLSSTSSPRDTIAAQRTTLIPAA